jgi:hypothetical protein
MAVCGVLSQLSTVVVHLSYMPIYLNGKICMGFLLARSWLHYIFHVGSPCTPTTIASLNSKIPLASKDTNN